nr:uncharacterized protein LOC113805895 isoform X2 [Penaeus vannamei]XP_027212767.1 uncharacterized protein LOC113805895 isoform X2 [Penaeus vannamei]
MGKKAKPSVAPMMEILNEKGKKKKKLDDNLNIENSPVKEEVSIATEESETERTLVKKKKKKKHKKDGHDESLNDSENLTDSQKSPKKRTHPSEVKSSPKKIKKERKEAVVDEDDEEKEPINANEAEPLDLWTPEEKLMLISRMQEKLQPNDKISYRRRLAGPKWNWNDIAFDNKSAKECEEQFHEIIESINKIKTLEQILTEAEQLTRSGGLRKKNLNAFQYFMRQHTQTLKTNGKNENLRGRELFSVLINNWYSLDEAEKKRYKILAKEEGNPKDGLPVSAPRLPFEIYYSIESDKIGSKNKQLKAELRTKYNALKKKTKLKYIEESFKEFHKYKQEVAEYLKINPSYKTLKKFPNKEEAELFLINHLKMPREPPYQPSTAYYHQLLEEGKLDDLPGKERLITATRQFANLPLGEQTAITEQTKQKHEEYRKQVALWKEKQEDYVMDIVNRYFPETSKKGKKEKAQKGKNTLNKFENVQVTTMNAPKFSELPKKPPRTGFLLFSAKFEHKMKGKFSDAKERKESCKDYWNKLPEEHKQIYRNRSRELQEEYKNNLFEFVNNLEEAERVMYLGHYRKQVRAYFCRDIFEEQYPNKVYPVYIASPKKKLRTAVNGMTVKDEAIDSDSDELPVAKKKPKDKNIDIENTESSSSPDSSDQEEEEEEEEIQGLDPNSAFVATAAAKKLGGYGAMSKHEEKGKTLSKSGSQDDDGSNSTGIDPVVLQSRQLAIRGNEAASVGQYSVAVRLFTDAIRLDPNDHRFFGNRSYCYDQLGQHEKALKDAEKAIKIAPQWPKGHYRRGTSLNGLGKYIDAESAFEEVLRLDKGCQEARDEIHKVRIIRIIEMGFTERQANSAISKYINVQPALDALLAGEFKESMEDVFYSDDEDDFSKRVKMPQATKGVKMNMRIGSFGDTSLVTGRNTTTNVGPRNPEGLTSLWVGNVVPDVTEKVLSQLFSKQGHVTSVRLLKEKYCAFVNYANKAAAGRAMEALQGHELCGQRLLIKFPDNPIVNGAQNVILRKSKPQPIKNNVKVNGAAGVVTSNILFPQSQAQTQPQPNAAKLKGPVNGDECYFWRTTGCAFGEACKHKHIPNNKGIDRKPWQM